MFSDCFLVMLTKGLSRDDISELLSSPVRGRELSPDNHAALIGLLTEGVFPSKARLPAITQDEWYTYQDSLAHVVYRGIELLKTAQAEVEAETPLMSKPVFWAAAAALYLHTGFFEGLSSLDCDAATLLAIVMPLLEPRLQIAGLAFLEDVAAADTSARVDTEAVLLDEPRLVIVKVAAALVVSYHRAVFESGVPNPKYNPLLRRFLAELAQVAGRTGKLLREIDGLFEKQWGTAS